MVAGATGWTGWAFAPPAASSAPIEATEARSTLRMKLISSFTGMPGGIGSVQSLAAPEIRPHRQTAGALRRLKTASHAASNEHLGWIGKSKTTVAGAPHVYCINVNFYLVKSAEN